MAFALLDRYNGGDGDALGCVAGQTQTCITWAQIESHEPEACAFIAKMTFLLKWL